MSNGKELRALLVLAGRVDPSLQTAMARAAGETARVSQGLHQAEKHALSFGDAVKASFLGNTLANGFSAGMDLLGKQMMTGIKLASDLTEVQNVVDVTFGKSAGQINAWAKTTLDAYGITELQSKQYSGTMGAMLQSSGLAGDKALVMSQNLTQLSGDIASFFNLNSEDAWEKIRSGMSGETEPLKQLGIDMSVANMEAFALKKGIKASWNEMDQASQSQLRYAFLLERTAKYQNDYRNTKDSPANQAKALKQNVDQMSATIMSAAIPSLAKLAKEANSFVSSKQMAELAGTAGVAFSMLGDGINGTRKVIADFSPVITGTAVAVGAYVIATTAQTQIKKIAIAQEVVWNALITGEEVKLGLLNGVMYFNTLMKEGNTVATAAATTAQWAWNAAMTANPIGVVVVGLGALVAAGVAVYNNWDFLVKKAKELWDMLANSPVGKLVGSGVHALQVNVSQNEGKSLPPMNRKKYGGIVDEPSIFGEAGREIAIPLRKSPRSVSLLNAAASEIGMPSSGGTYVFQIDARGAEKGVDQDIERMVVRVMERHGINRARVAYGKL